MPATLMVDQSTELNLARESLYRFLAALLSDPHADRFPVALDPANQQLARAASELLQGWSPLSSGGEGLPVRGPDLQPLLIELDRPLEDLRAEYRRVFGLVSSRACPPHETEYHANTDPFFRSQQMADVAGFYRAFGLNPSSLSRERPDHIALELEFMALVLMKERFARADANPDADTPEAALICAETQRSFLRDHLAWWVPGFTRGLERQSGNGVYAELARYLAGFIAADAHHLGISVEASPVRPRSMALPLADCGCDAADCGAIGKLADTAG